MTDYIKIISEKLNEGIPVVLYTAGGNTLSIIRVLKNRYNVLPTAVCDGDPAKQDRTYKGLEGLVIISPDEAISRYPDSEFFISSIPYIYEIIGYLIYKKDFKPERIINYEQVVWRKSCIYMERFINTLPNADLAICCAENSPFIDFNDLSAADDFLNFRDKLIRGCENDEISDTCKKCNLICEGWCPETPRINDINYFTGGMCNFKCIYCKSPIHDKNYLTKRHLDLKSLISDFQKNNMLSEYFNIDLATSGEPTIHPQRKELYEALNCNSNLILTNGYKFDDDLFNIMNEKPVRLFVSIDAGTCETYAKIKSVDCFDKVCENLKRYAKSKCGNIILKYIFMPGINDTEEEIDGFVQLCVETDTVIGVISYNLLAELPVPEKTLLMMTRLKKGLEKKGILCAPFNASTSKEYDSALKEGLKR